MRPPACSLLAAWSLSARRAWIEIARFSTLLAQVLKSLSARRAWIEISFCAKLSKICGVALRKESVDRNPIMQCFTVVSFASLSARRAWIEMLIGMLSLLIISSLSARRAWIEIFCGLGLAFGGSVALRKESVDRNLAHLGDNNIQNWSLSARRAWIEIIAFCLKCSGLLSLSARRAWIEIHHHKNKIRLPNSRSPQGERG